MAVDNLASAAANMRAGKLQALAVTMAQRSLLQEGIRVNAVVPGVMLTAMTAMTAQTRKDPRHVEYMLRRIPLKRY